MPSTSIARTEYDDERQILSVWFVANGRRYDYEGVPADIYHAFLRAFSKGRYFNAMIRDRYPARWIREPSPRGRVGVDSQRRSP